MGAIKQTTLKSYRIFAKPQPVCFETIISFPKLLSLNASILECGKISNWTIHQVRKTKPTFIMDAALIAMYDKQTQS